MLRRLPLAEVVYFFWKTGAGLPAGFFYVHEHYMRQNAHLQILRASNVKVHVVCNRRIGQLYFRKPAGRFA